MIVLRLEATLDVGVITRLVGGNYKVAGLLGSQSSALCPIESRERTSPGLRWFSLLVIVCSDLRPGGSGQICPI